ncbi:DUF5511 family protein [Bacillales bacterium AN1005]
MLEEVANDYSVGELFMIEEIVAESNTLILANYVFNKRKEVSVSDERIAFYADQFDKAIENNLFLFVEFDERRGVIVG